MSSQSKQLDKCTYVSQPSLRVRYQISKYYKDGSPLCFTGTKEDMPTLLAATVRRCSIRHYYMALAVSGQNREILQFDWFISGRIFPVLPVQGGKFKKALLVLNKN